MFTISIASLDLYAVDTRMLRFARPLPFSGSTTSGSGSVRTCGEIVVEWASSS